MNPDERIVSRELKATAIPSGEGITIPEGAKVTITHRLGGNFTVVWDFGMARITGDDADAIGEEKPEAPARSGTPEDYAGPPDQGKVWEALRSVYDPEIPVNIVDLGLVYSMDVIEQEAGRHNVEVKMTLTAPGCGMGPAIAQDAKYRVEQVAGVSDAQVDVVWDPPWNQEMISEEGRMQLGLV